MDYNEYSILLINKRKKIMVFGLIKILDLIKLIKKEFILFFILTESFPKVGLPYSKLLNGSQFLLNVINKFNQI